MGKCNAAWKQLLTDAPSDGRADSARGVGLTHSGKQLEVAQGSVGCCVDWQVL